MRRLPFKLLNGSTQRERERERERDRDRDRERHKETQRQRESEWEIQKQVEVYCHESCPVGKTEQFPLDGPAASQNRLYHKHL